MITDEMVEKAAFSICQSGKFECGLGRCAPVCADLGHKPTKCANAVRVHGKLARSALEAALSARPASAEVEAMCERLQAVKSFTKVEATLSFPLGQDGKICAGDVKVYGDPVQACLDAIDLLRALDARATEAERERNGLMESLVQSSGEITEHCHRANAAPVLIARGEEKALAELMSFDNGDWFWDADEPDISDENAYNVVFEQPTGVIVRVKASVHVGEKFGFLLDPLPDAETSDMREFWFDTKEEAAAAIRALKGWE